MMGRHIGGMGVQSLFLDLPNAGGAIGTKQESKKLRYLGVKVAAIGHLRIIRTLGASAASIRLATGADGTPRGFYVFAATGAFLAQKGTTRPAVKSAMGHEKGIGNQRRGIHRRFHDAFDLITPAARCNVPSPLSRVAIESIAPKSISRFPPVPPLPTISVRWAPGCAHNPPR